MSRRLSIGVFADEHGLVQAAGECRARGLKSIAAYSPYPIHGIDAVLGIRRSRLPIVCLVGGALGLALGLWFQLWSSAVDWPLDVGGKPFNSLPAFVPVAFELMVLCAGLATAVALIVRSGLGPGRPPKLYSPRTTDDRFVLVLEQRDQSVAADEVVSILQRHGALECRGEVVD